MIKHTETQDVEKYCIKNGASKPITIDLEVCSAATLNKAIMTTRNIPKKGFIFAIFLDSYKNILKFSASSTFLFGFKYLNSFFMIGWIKDFQMK